MLKTHKKTVIGVALFALISALGAVGAYFYNNEH